jgi:hypothetical protein
MIYSLQQGVAQKCALNSLAANMLRMHGSNMISASRPGHWRLPALRIYWDRHAPAKQRTGVPENLRRHRGRFGRGPWRRGRNRLSAQKTPEPAARGGRRFGSQYGGEYLNQIAFPMGGLGAGMICLEGVGALSHVSLRNRPEIFHEPCVFAAIAIQGAPGSARVVEGPVPARKIFGGAGSGNGEGGATYGLPRFATAAFQARFPFATVSLSDPRCSAGSRIDRLESFRAGRRR